MTATVRALCVGKSASLPDGGRKSAIDKRAVDGPVSIGVLGLAGDHQVDRRFHGGPHMAVHHYPADHYTLWRSELPDVARLGDPGAFGENIHAQGLIEADVFIGDQFRAGTALLEVSMGRQPCNTLQLHFRQPDMVRRIIGNHRCGWYYRVIEEGTAQAGDDLILINRVQEEWSVARAFSLLFDPRFERSQGDAAQLLALPALGPQWQAKASAKVR